MDRVLLLSPFRASTKEKHRLYRTYLKRALRDSILEHGEAPLASHELYTRALRDNEPKERDLGIKMALEWLDVCHRVVVYADHGVSEGMEKELGEAAIRKVSVVYRYIDRRR